MRLPTPAIVLGLLVTVAAPANAASLAPDWTLISSAGATVRLSEEVRKQPTILFFWATWCPYCKALMPHLQSLRLEHEDAIKILAINIKEDGDPVEFIRNAGYDFTVLPDGDAVATAYGIYGTPGLLIVDRERVVRFDLRQLPRRDPPPNNAAPNHKRIAAYRAPYWAAEIRKHLDQVLSESAP